jgi:acetyltransferase-like isoleucine patch superfamily enzyme
MSISKESLKALYFEIDQEMRSTYDRSLPFDEYIFDRFARAKILEAGQGSSVHHSSYVYGKVKIGQNTWVGPFTLLDGSGGLEIGNNCSISSGVHIYTHDTVKKRISGGASKGEQSSVKIGNSCYVGPQTIIARGVELGDFTIVGANSFVKGNFPARSVLMGTPAKIKGTVEFDTEGKATVKWFPSEDLDEKIKNLESRIHALENKQGSL